MSRNYRPGSRRDIVIGSVWRSRDPRDGGRLITIESTEGSHFGNGFVVAKSVRRTRLRVSTLLERYDVVTTEATP